MATRLNPKQPITMDNQQLRLEQSKVQRLSLYGSRPKQVEVGGPLYKGEDIV